LTPSTKQNLGTAHLLCLLFRSNLQASDFIHESNLDLVVNKINSYLLNYALEAKHHGVRKKFWDTLDSVINLKKCRLYSFVPDDESEVFGQGHVWTMNYFFVNKEAKKIIFFTCSATRKLQFNPKMDADPNLIQDGSLDENIFEMEIDDHFSPAKQRSHIDLTVPWSR